MSCVDFEAMHVARGLGGLHVSHANLEVCAYCTWTRGFTLYIWSSANHVEWEVICSSDSTHVTRGLGGLRVLHAD